MITRWACLGVLAGVLLPAWVIPPLIGTRFWSVHDLFVAVGIAAGVVAIACSPELVRRRACSPAERFLVVFLLMGSVGVLLGPAPVAQFLGSLEWLEVALLTVLLARVADVPTLRRLLRIYGWMVVAVSLTFIADRLLGMELLRITTSRNHIALLIIVPIFTVGLDLAESRGARQLIPGSALLVLLVMLASTRSRAVILGFAFAAVVALVSLLIRDGWRHPRRARLVRFATLVLLAGGALAASEIFLLAQWEDGVLDLARTVAHSDEGSIGGRIRRWQNAWPLIQAHPWLGRGFEAWYPAFDAFRHSRVADSAGNASAANTYLRIAAEAGLLGLAAFVAFCGLVVSRPARHRIERCLRLSFVVWLIALFFHSAPDYHLVLAGFGFAAGLALWRERETHRDAAWPKRQIVVWVLLWIAIVCLHAKYTIRSLEATMVTTVLKRSELHPEPLLWRLLDPVSTVVRLPMRREDVLARRDRIRPHLLWATPGPDDPFLAMGDALQESLDLTEAEEWFRQALLREPTSLKAMQRLCVVREQMGDAAGARRYCEQMLSVNADEPDALSGLARLDLGSGDVERAFERLSKARSVWWRRLDVNDFGMRSLQEVARNYREYRRVSSERSGLAGVSSELTASTALEDISQVPLIHSVIAARGCRLYFSANMNARYNLWEADVCQDPPIMVPRTNDARAPYQLTATAEGVYFVSDDRGDGRYALYFLGHKAGRAREVAAPRGRLETFAVNPPTGEVAVVTIADGSYRLWLAEARGDLLQVYADDRRLTDVVASPVGDRWAFVADGRELLEWSRGESGVRTILRKGSFLLGRAAYSPHGSRMVAAQRQGANASRLVVLEAGRPARIVYASEAGIATDPIWTSESTIAFREKVADEYSLRRLDVASGRVEPLGPQQGVVYRPTFDAASNTLWFARAGAERPRYLMGLDLEGEDPPVNLAFDWIEPEQILPTSLSTVTTGAGEARVYTVTSARPETRQAVVWLHGSGDSYSPRWHSISQILAHHGYRVVAINYSTGWSIDRGSHPAPSEVTAEQVERLVEQLRGEGIEQVHLLGVSAGTEVLQAVLRRGRAQIASAIEFAPLDSAQWAEPTALPPMLIVAGENDPGFHLQRRRRQIEAHRARGSTIELMVLKNEGHELRGRSGIEDRMAATLRFLASQAVPDSGEITSRDD